VTISEALEITRAKTSDPQQQYEIVLACGFTPLHLQIFLTAHLNVRNRNLNFSVKPGVFGDLAGCIESAVSNAAVQAIAIVLEWQDIDSRLGYREAGSWGRPLEAEIFESAGAALGRIAAAVERSADSVPVAISLPTLPFPPAFHAAAGQASEAELLVRRKVAALATRLAGKPNVSVLSGDWLAEAIPLSRRLDLKSDLLIGSPYAIAHADAVASGLARLLSPAQPLKGLITDLDETFWNGIVGEVGPEAVRWDSASAYQLHGLYQKMLGALAGEGVLVAVASKNDAAAVEEAFKRTDLLIPAGKIFPIETHWAPKSESIARILKAWNISADAVAFVDDTPLELAEAASAHPGIHCLRFPTGDYDGVLALLKQMRDLFARSGGKSRFTDEDRLRLDSIRNGAQFHKEIEESGGSDEFLRQINARITLDTDVSPANPRILELVNKTNQFNLNGIRFTAAEWQKKLAMRGAFLFAVKYEDQFGRLGTVAVILGHETAGRVKIEAWVMSCRAFSRRIEHQCMKALFERFRVPRIEFQFASTAKNGPAREFFATFLGAAPDAAFSIERGRFQALCPALYHQVEQITGVNING